MDIHISHISKITVRFLTKFKFSCSCTGPVSSGSQIHLYNTVLVIDTEGRLFVHYVLEIYLSSSEHLGLVGRVCNNDQYEGWKILSYSEIF